MKPAVRELFRFFRAESDVVVREREHWYTVDLERVDCCGKVLETRRVGGPGVGHSTVGAAIRAAKSAAWGE